MQQMQIPVLPVKYIAKTSVAWRKVHARWNFFKFTVLHNRFSMGTKSLNHDACSTSVSICASTWAEIFIILYCSIQFHFSVSAYYFLTVSNATLMLTLKGSDDGIWHSGLQGFWTLSIVRYSKKQKNTMFRKLDLFPFSCEEAGDTYSVGPIRKFDRGSLFLMSPTE
jgi:hypothetical protein